MIAVELLQKYGAVLKTYKKEEAIFMTDDEAHFYYQVESGEVKMNNYNKEGREFIQGIFSKGKSFGEPPLFGNFPYPANATAINNVEVWRLGKPYFLQLLHENPEIHMRFTEILAKRLQYKAVRVSEISNQSAEHRILSLIDHLKNNEEEKFPEPFTFEVPLTRQQIADLTGLRVETVIRTIKKLETEGTLQVRNRKVYR